MAENEKSEAEIMREMLLAAGAVEEDYNDEGVTVQVGGIEPQAPQKTEYELMLETLKRMGSKEIIRKTGSASVIIGQQPQQPTKNGPQTTTE
jgi:hypothetical protein